MAELLGLNGNQQGKTFPLTKDLTRFGRSPDNDLVLEDGSVSGSHCFIRQGDAGIYTLHDLDSSNGTRINDEDVHEHPIAHSDTIEMGNQLFRFIQHKEEAPKPAKPSSKPAAPASERPAVKKPERSREKRSSPRKLADPSPVKAASVSDQQSPLTQRSMNYTVCAIAGIVVLTVSIIIYIHLIMK